MNYFKQISGYVLVSIILTPTLCVLIDKKEVPHMEHILERPLPTAGRQLYVSGISSTMSVSDSSSHII